MPAPTPDRKGYVLIFDVRSGTNERIEIAGNAVVTLDGDELRVRENYDTVRRFSLDGKFLREEPKCRQSQRESTIGDWRFPGYCGELAPDGGHLLYEGPVDPTLTFDAMLLDMQTGTSRPVGSGFHFAQGDGFWFSSWSPGGRYFVMNDWGHGLRYLYDVLADVQRALGGGSQPAWSTDGARVAYTVGGQGQRMPRIRVEELATGAVRDYDFDAPLEYAYGSAPMRFDASGTLLYTPSSFVDLKRQTGPTTTLIDVTSGRVVAQLPGGAPAAQTRTQTSAVGRSSSGYVAALQYADDCPGTSVYVAGRPGAVCYAASQSGSPSPDGSRVALAVAKGEITVEKGQETFTFIGRAHDIAVASVADGSMTILAHELDAGDPPLLLWSADGSRLIVAWPNPIGGI